MRRSIPPLLRRETNRHRGAPTTLSRGCPSAPSTAPPSGRAAGCGCCPRAIQIAAAAEFLAAADRIRYLTPPLHREMTSELRWPGDDPLDSGIDVRSLELDAGTLLALDILKRPR